MPEGNKIKWWGIRPTDPEEVFTRYEEPINTTYLEAYNLAAGSEVQVYEVLTGTKLYLTTLVWSLMGGPLGYGYVLVRVIAGATTHRLVYTRTAAGESKHGCCVYNVALQIPAGHEIVCMSDPAGFSLDCSIVGYLRSV